MKVLVVGGGGREHALAWKIAQSDRVERVFVAPGNAGTANESKCGNVAISADDCGALLEFATDNGVDLAVIGPEAPLVAGIVDLFEDSGLRCFGPSARAAELEGSKAFSKEFLARHRIPTAAFKTFTEVPPAHNYVRERGAPIVVKADGLAAGKGVVVAETEAQAIAAIDDMLAGNVFGAAGRRVVIEEFLSGEEASFIVMVDGEQVLPMASSQDHKARDDGDRGPNTGGMGAYSPAPVVTDAMSQRIMRDVIEPTVRGMAADGRRYRGFLYAGVMIGEDNQPKVLEFNCRFGDPETQPIMLRLRSDLLDLIEAALNGSLAAAPVEWDQRAALGVVMAAAGYPGAYSKGEQIAGLPAAGDAEVETLSKVFHAGTTLSGDRVVTAGGRVLCATALGDSVGEAQHNAYALAGEISWNGVYFRRDIGYRAVARELAVAPTKA